MITIPSLTTFINTGKMCGTPAACPPSSGAATIPSSASTGSSNKSSSAAASSCCGFQMPLHYPRFKKADYEKMPEPQLDCLLREYGLPTIGDVNEKRKFAMGAFLWPDQY